MNSNELKIVAYDKDIDIHIITAVTSYIDSHISCENFSLISGTNKQYILYLLIQKIQALEMNSIIKL